MESYYEINVSLNGQHLFATAPRSIKTVTALTKMVLLFKEKFPESEGYCITNTYWECIGHTINIET